MTGLGHRDYRRVVATPGVRRSARRAAALVVLAASVATATFVLRSLGESAAQVRVLVDAVAARARAATATEPASVPAAPPGPVAAGSAAAPATEPFIEPHHSTPPKAATPLPGPPTGGEFARLVASSLASEADADALEELSRALDSAVP
jgi:hypothetical protein